jgi:hypothetical protein
VLGRQLELIGVGMLCCEPVWGVCNHAFHLHCIYKWYATHSVFCTSTTKSNGCRMFLGRYGCRNPTGCCCTCLRVWRGGRVSSVLGSGNTPTALIGRSMPRNTTVSILTALALARLCRVNAQAQGSQCPMCRREWEFRKEPPSGGSAEEEEASQ